MFLAFLAAMAMSSRTEVPAEAWNCSNQIEVWCTVDSCDAKAADETTPMAVSAHRDGGFSVCAYTGCWEGRAAPVEALGRRLWVADDVAFSSNESFTANISLLIIEKEGVGFVRVGGIATPLLCARAEPGGP